MFAETPIRPVMPPFLTKDFNQRNAIASIHIVQIVFVFNHHLTVLFDKYVGYSLPRLFDKCKKET